MIWGCALVAQPQASLDTLRALQAYDRGDVKAFEEMLWRDDSPETHQFPAFRLAAEAWLRADPRLTNRRVIVAASVAVEVAYRLRTWPTDRPARYLVWASDVMARHVAGAPTDAERLWHLSAVAAMQSLDEPWVLSLGHPTGSAVLEPIARSLGPGGHVARALVRFPDEPRLLLSDLMAREFALSFLLDAGRSFWAAVDAAASQRVTEGAERGEELQALADRNHARDMLDRREQIGALIDRFLALESHAVLRAEIALRVGRLELLRGRTAAARDRFRRVPELTDDPFLRYLSHYFAAGTWEVEGVAERAVGALEEAIRIVPNARSSATRMAALLMQSDQQADRVRAYEVLQAAYGRSSLDDPWRLYSQGEARSWPEYVARLRAALQ